MSLAVTTSPSHRLARSPAGAAQPLFDILKEEIISLALKPGMVLSRADLEERFGVSSTPIREALLRLREEGLVDVFPQHATVVTTIDLDHARQAQFLRRSIELEVVHTLASKPETTVIAGLRGLVNQQKAFAALGEYQQVLHADLSYHHLMYEAAAVPNLWMLVRRQSGHIDRLRRLHLPVGNKLQDIIRDHSELADAIEAGNPAGAQEVLRSHLSRSLDFAEKLRELHPEHFSPRR